MVKSFSLKNRRAESKDPIPEDPVTEDRPNNRDNSCDNIEQWNNLGKKIDTSKPFYKISYKDCSNFAKKCTNFLLNDSVFKKLVKNITAIS